MTIVSTGQITIVDVNDGSNAYLTNNSAVLPADSAGTVSSYTGAETFFKVVEANVDTTNNWSFYVSATGGGVAYRDSDDVADRTGTGTAGYLGGTNRIRNSTGVGAVAGTPGTLPTNWAIAGSGTGTLTRQIVGTGTAANGIAYIDIKFTGTISTASFIIAAEASTGGPAASASQTWIASNYVAIVGGNTTNITAIRAVSVTARTAAGAAVGVDEFNSGDNKASLTTTLQRFSASRALTDGTTAALQPGVGFVLGTGTIGDPTNGITIRIGLPQLELGSTATEVTPTTGTAASGTRGYLKITSLTQDLSYLDITASKIGGQSFTQRYSVARATKGATGTRGTITTSAATAGTVWVDAEANTAISTAGGGSPLAGDVVTLYNSASAFSQTRVRTSGGAWAALAAFFGGDVLVDGTLGAVKLAANSVTANKIAAGAITTSKLLVAPASLCPSPYFEDTAWWTATLYDATGWYFESGTAFTGTSVQAALWSGHPTNIPGTARKHLWSGNVAAPAVGTSVRLRARVRNDSNQVIYVAARFYTTAGATISDATLVSAATSGQQDLTTQIVVPNNSAFIRFIVYNEGVTTYSGAAAVSAVMLNTAAGADLIVDGAITAAKITANTITAGQIAANTITASRLLIADLSNIAPDADMADSNSWSAPTAWETPPSASWRGSRVARLDGAASAYTVLNGKVFPVEAGAALHFSFQGQVLAGAAGAFGGQLRLSAATDMSTPTYLGATTSTSTTLVTLSGNVTIPAGMKYARVELYKNNDAATSVRVGGVVVRRAANAELIVDGAISAAKISAGAITTDKLLVTGQGTAINPDPNTTDISAWDGIGISIVADTASPTGSALAITSQGATTYTKRFALDASKNYDLRMTMRRVSGTATTYLLVAFFDANDAAIPASTYGVGWPYGGSFHYFGLAGVVGPTSYTEYRISFGPDETPKIPPGAKYARVGMLANYSGGAGEQRFTSIRLAEKASADLIVDGAISANKIAANAIAVGTAAIQNGAIVNAMIGTAAIDSAKIADAAITTAKIGDAQITNAKIDTLSAAKITTGTLDAGRIAANSITATMIDSRGLSIKDASGTVIFSSGVPLSSTNIRGIVDASWWKQGTAIPWARNLANGNDDFINATLPDGSTQIVWRATAGASDSALPGGGWNVGGSGNDFTPDVTRTYMFVCYQKHISGSGSGWWGTASVCDLNTSTSNTNPYFAGSFTAPVNDRWYMYIGWVYPAGSTGMTTGRAGIWDCTTGLLVQGGANYCWPSTASATGTRAYQYYSAGGVHYFSRPQVYLCDGTEPNFDQLLAFGSPSARNPITSSNVSTYIASAAITNAYIGGTIQSDNYSAGSAGWAIAKSGSAEFNTGTFRGALSAASGTFAGSLSAAGGTFAGTLTAAAVNAVNTINIGANQVTFPVAAFTAAAVNSPATETTVQTASITTSGAPVIVWAGLFVNMNSGGGGTFGLMNRTVTVRLKRGTTILQAFSLYVDETQTPQITSFQSFAPYRESLVAGTYAYTITVIGLSDFDGFGTGANVSNRGLVVMEAKR